MTEGGPSIDQSKTKEALHIIPMPTEAMHAVAAWVQSRHAEGAEKIQQDITAFEQLAATKPHLSPEMVAADIAQARAKFGEIDQTLQTLQEAKIINVINERAGLKFATDGTEKTSLAGKSFILDKKTADAMIGALKHVLQTAATSNPLIWYGVSSDDEINAMGRTLSMDGLAIQTVLNELTPEGKARKEMHISVDEQERVSIAVIPEDDPPDALKTYPLVKTSSTE